MDIEKMLEDEAFKNIEPERLEAVKKIADEVKGKNTHEVMLIILKHSKVLSSGKKISPEERDAMVGVIYSSLTPQEQEQFKGVIKVIENFT